MEGQREFSLLPSRARSLNLIVAGFLGRQNAELVHSHIIEVTENMKLREELAYPE